MKPRFLQLTAVWLLCSLAINAGTARAQTPQPPITPQFEGSYQGRILREQADGLRQEGTIYVAMTDFGVVFGSFSFALPGRLRTAWFQGKVDATGRGFIKLYIDDLLGSGHFLLEPGAEKIPVQFSLKGSRVVGGSIDQQGTVLTFRALLVPPPEPGPEL